MSPKGGDEMTAVPISELAAYTAACSGREIEQSKMTSFKASALCKMSSQPASPTSWLRIENEWMNGWVFWHLFLTHPRKFRKETNILPLTHPTCTRETRWPVNSDWYVSSTCKNFQWVTVFHWADLQDWHTIHLRHNFPEAAICCLIKLAKLPSYILVSYRDQENLRKARSNKVA